VTHDVLTLAAAGFAAGLAIAMPLGAIALLILRESLTFGLRTGLAAGAGVATVDLVYCTVAVVAGATLSPLIEPWLPALAIASGAVIIVIGLVLLRGALRPAAAQAELVPGRPLSVYARFVGLTALNPATIVYFAALSAVLASVSATGAGTVAFVVGVALGSLLWQSGLAIVGAAIGAKATERATRIIGIVAACVVTALGVVAIVIAVTQY